jgi:DNA-binding beta-propeller fold protein YncE
VASDHSLGLFAQPDASVWVAEPLAGRVQQWDALGRLRRSLHDEALASRPVAVLAPPGTQDVWVGDATEARVVVFNAAGRVLTRWGGGRLQSLAALALGPEGLYVLDRLAQQVLVFNRSGQWLRSLGEDSLLQPRTLAVDSHGRVYVGDDADQRIKVFAGSQRIASFGGMGTGPGRFARIDSLCADDAQLYVADSQGARVQVLLIAPPSLRGGQ